MSFLSKVRTLVGALVHKPFSPRPEHVQLEQAEPMGPGQGRAELQTKPRDVAETERVADLIAQQKQDEAR